MKAAIEKDTGIGTETYKRLIMRLIRIYWDLVFKLINWLTKNPDYHWASRIVVGIVEKDMDHIGGSWDAGHVFDINPQDIDPDDLF